MSKTAQTAQLLTRALHCESFGSINPPWLKDGIAFSRCSTWSTWGLSWNFIFFFPSFMPLSLCLPTALSFACLIAFTFHIHTQTLTKVKDFFKNSLYFEAIHHTNSLPVTVSRCFIGQKTTWDRSWSRLQNLSTPGSSRSRRWRPSTMFWTCVVLMWPISVWSQRCGVLLVTFLHCGER